MHQKLNLGITYVGAQQMRIEDGSSGVLLSSSSSMSSFSALAVEESKTLMKKNAAGLH